MDKSEAKQLFLEADALFEQGEFEASLHILQRLNREFPRQKHIMYSAALCLEQLGRAQECIGLCQQLIARHQDERADVILSRLAGIENVEQPLLNQNGARRLNHEDHRLLAMLMQDPVSQTPLPAQHGPARALLYGLGFAAFVLAFLLFAGSFLYFSPGHGATGGRPGGFNAGQVLVLYFATSFTANLVTMYVLLHLMRRLRYEEPLDNAFDVMQYAFFVSLLLLVPVVGWFLIPPLLRRHYGFSLGELLLFLLLQIVLAIGFSLIFGVALLLLGQGWVFTRAARLAG